MKCVICNLAETVPGLTSVVLERGQMKLTVNNVPARLCPHCGEAYADETVAANLLRQANKMVREGMKVDEREYEI
jgi:YgiT-type zinc finger domain-containing protein